MASSLSQVLSQRLEDLAARPLQPVEVAVLDSGVDTTHPDLLARVVEAFTIELASGEPEVRKRDLGQNGDPLGHGTAVASIIAKLAPNARIVDYRVLGASNLGAGAAVLEALREVLTRGSRVINMSLAVTAEFESRLRPLCETAYRQGQVAVAAKRNMPLVDFGFPAEFSSCVSVDIDHFASSYKLRYQSDSPIEFAGNGEDVIVAATGGGYTTKTGTSFATPAVTGLCALLLGAFPDLRPFEIKAALKAFAD
jgi:subtilisin